MTLLRHAAASAALLLASALTAGASQAAVFTIGGGLGRDCYLAAKRGAEAEIDTCDRALREEGLSRRDRAATFVNRGILLMGVRRYQAALDDYTEAVRLRPDLGDAHVNQGAALIALDRVAEGLAATDRGLSFDTAEPEKAYFNRAIGREELGDLKGAYEDYQKASTLAPAWEAPRRELARFTVRRANDG